MFAGYVGARYEPRKGVLLLAINPGEEATLKSLNRKIDVLRRVLNLASRKWRDDLGRPYLVAVPLIAHVKGPARTPHILTDEEQERLLAACPDHLRDAVLFAVNTGMRAGEQRQLRWDWETEHGGFLLPGSVTKTAKARYVPCNKIARDAINRQRENDPDYVWTYDGAPIGRRFNNHAFRRARKRAKVDVTWHDLRHTFATRARATGAALTDVAAIPRA
jgi:integrase